MRFGRSGPRLWLAAAVLEALRALRKFGFASVLTAATLCSAVPAFAAPPSTGVTAISPNGGTIANGGTTDGGQSITITGSGFYGGGNGPVAGITVSIAGVSPTSVTVVSDTSITATTAAYTGQPPKTGDVVVNVPGNSAPATGTLTNGFTYVQPPATVTGVSINHGPSTGGTTFTITGTHLNYTTGVTIGGVAVASYAVINDSSITVTTAADTSASAPTVTGISPSHGGTGGGTSVTISGTNFQRVADAVVTNSSGTASATNSNDHFVYEIAGSVFIGGTAATNVVLSPLFNNTLTATTPAGIPGVADVIVGNSGTSGSKLYTYTDGGPGITSVGPQYGLSQGGNSITVTGSNFIPGTKKDGSTATTVTIGGNPATNVVVNSTVTLSATVPAGTAGARQLVVSTVAGSASSSYQYVDPATPVVTSVTTSPATSPSSGSTTGGTQITITGANFTGTTSVTIGGVAVNSFNVTSPGTITTVTPAHGAGLVDVVVTVVAPNGGGTFTGTGTGLFTYITPAPVVTSISPNVGSTAGGTHVTITGTNLAGASSVTIGGVPATSVQLSPSGTSITAITGAHAAATNQDVVVTATSGTGTGSGLYTYGTPPPTVTSVTPSGGPVSGGGSAVTITGTGFTGVTGVTFGGTAATSVTFVSDTSITVVPPAHSAGAVNVSVTTPAGTGTGGGLYTYGASVPTVTSISPTSGTTLGNTPVTITGTGFSGTPNVTINGVQAANVIVTSPTTITALTPANPAATNDAVIVITSIGPSVPANIYSYVAPANAAPPPAPTITGITANGISPATGPVGGGTLITITGTNLTGATAVTIDGIAATSVTVVNSTTVTALTPPDSAGPKNVFITTLGGTNSAAGQFTYVVSPPTVTSVNLNSGTTLGGTSVTITGTNFTGASAVTFGGIAATSFSVVNATTISAKTPAHAAGQVNVAVTTGTNPNTLTGTGTALYTYVAGSSPTVTALSVNHGDVGGGTSITITGTNFTGATSITIGGTAVQFPIVVNSTKITATTPAHVAGAFDTVVTTPIGTSPTSAADVFTYTTKPTVTSISPTTGPAAGGTVVTITGTNFTSATTVAFGSTPGTSVVVNGPTSITVTSPAGTGVQNVTVTTVGGTSAISTPDQFTYSSPPTVTLLTPNAGPVAGGTSVTITGTNFTGATSVKFGNTNTTSFSVNSSTSISAIAPAGSGAVDVKVTTAGGTSATNIADTFSYGKAATSLALTSSPNPSVVGQPVTFTAKITGNSPTGLVTFSYGNTVLGTSQLSNGVATLKISSLPVGSDLVSASYPGDANNAADPESLIQVVQANSDSTMLRQMQLTVMPIVANLSGQAISGAIDSALGVGFGNDPQMLTPNSGGFTYYFYGGTQQQASNQAGEKITSSAQALMSPSTDANSKIDDDFKALSYADTPGFASAPPAAKAGPQPSQVPRDWLVWVDIRGAGFGHTGSANDLSGTQVNVLAGVTRRVTPDFVVGALGGYEHFDFSSQAYNGVLRGSGFTLGGYAGLRLGPVRVDGAMAWSDITAADTAGTATGNFGGSRWLATGGVTGNFTWAGLAFEPSTRFYALWETENAYIDSLGTQQARHDFNTGRASMGVKVSYPFMTGAGTLSPYVGIYGDYYLSKDDAPNPGLTSVLLLQGGAVRATGGLTAAFAGGPQLSFGGEYSRTGTDMHIWTMRVRGNVPF